MLRLALLLAAATVAAATAAPPSVTVTHDSLDLPARCSPREVATLVARFLDSYNQADAQALERFLAQEGEEAPGFQWLTLDRDGVYLRSGALPYLRELHESGARFELREIDVGRSWVRHGVGVSYRLTQTQADRVASVSGKGEIHCPSQAIYVWSMTTETALAVCPGESTESILACSRGGRRPNAQEVVPEPHVGEARVKLPGRCGVGAAHARVLRILRAFNLRDGKAAAANFTRDGFLHLYTGDARRGAFRRVAIAARVTSRAAAGDGLTLVALNPPSSIGSPPTRAVYGMTLRVDDKIDAGVKLVFDCRSGLLASWVGPAIASPS